MLDVLEPDESLVSAIVGIRAAEAAATPMTATVVALIPAAAAPPAAPASPAAPAAPAAAFFLEQPWPSTVSRRTCTICWAPAKGVAAGFPTTVTRSPAFAVI